MLKSSHGFQNLLKEVRFLITFEIYNNLDTGLSPLLRTGGSNNEKY